MSQRYGRIVTRVYTEALLWALLKQLSRAQNSSAQNNDRSVCIQLDSSVQDKNLIQFQRQKRLILLDQVSNEGLEFFLNSNIREIKNVNFLSCCCQSYIFSDGNKNPEDKANSAKTKINKIINGQNKFSRDDIGCIFTELNNAKIVYKKRKERFYSSPIEVDLVDLSEGEIQKYMQKICGAGGILDKYLYLSRDHKRSKSDLNPRLIAMMRIWIKLIFDCDILNWTTTHWDEFETACNIEYPSLYYPNQNHIRNILIENSNPDEFDQRLCIYLYNFLKNIYERQFF